MTNAVTPNGNNGWHLGQIRPQAVAPAQPGAVPPVGPGMPPGGYAPNPFQAANVMPIEWLADYPGAPDRLKMFGISNSEKLLSWGRTPSGRWALSHIVATFANGQTRDYINNKISQWVGQADLMRVGADHATAILMQMTGIYDASYLRFYANSIDQFQLYSALQMKRLATGMPLVSFQKLQEMCRAAMMTPPYIVWNNNQYQMPGYR